MFKKTYINNLNVVLFCSELSYRFLVNIVAKKYLLSNIK